MAFIRTDLSLVGSQGRAGVVPQVFAYTSPDSLATIMAAAYFPTNPSDPKLNVVGVFKVQDWVMVTHDTGGTPGFSIIVIGTDGSDGGPIFTFIKDINAT